MSIGIVGGGVWGSALARVLSNNKVIIYARDENIVKSINEHKINPKLKYSSFNDNVSATTSINDLDDIEFLFITLPAQSIRQVFSEAKINKINNVIICSKGIEISSSMFLSDVVNQILSYKTLSVLSGPSFSNEVVQNLPTAITLSTKEKKDFDKISNLIVSKNFRLYYSKDLIGTQIGGALKNIYAIASGISED